MHHQCRSVKHRDWTQPAAKSETGLEPVVRPSDLYIRLKTVLNVISHAVNNLDNEDKS